MEEESKRIKVIKTRKVEFILEDYDDGTQLLTKNVDGFDKLAVIGFIELIKKSMLDKII